MKTETFDIVALKERVENAITERKNFSYIVNGQGYVDVRFMDNGQVAVYVFTFATTRTVIPAKSLSIKYDERDDFLFIEWEGGVILVGKDGEFIEL